MGSASGTGRGRTPQGRGTSPGSSGGQESRGAGPGRSGGSLWHRPPPGRCYEPRLWSMDIALAIPQSDFILLVPLLQPDWNSVVLQKPVCTFPLRHRQYYCFCRKLVLTLTHSYTSSNSTRALKSTGAIDSSVDPSKSSLRMERNCYLSERSSSWRASYLLLLPVFKILFCNFYRA